ncbi:uncharacterized protein BT62DRAFT_1014318 [Guyanagaster necrorhizus]|uniref:Uncharacterized protein n=1 Tax=Guyanagaster necrorhizus TaxID=856835 RepID=A0A9P8AL16_9AGAR|nr:uncharacterized protein BT62DRAFT_1014318 [Guyanagaster necrorhizus MCA 3950]KAG7439146.1 hypothetical protein BT62DRAFT_1014318 [Guyanagaster necrorhizus MCA 3950]
MIVIHSIHSRSPSIMNRPGYPPSHQSGASQILPANSPAFTSTSLTSAPAYGAVTNVQTHRRIQPAVPMLPETSSTSRSPSDWSAPSRQTSRPCRCGRGRWWRFSYPIRMMIAIHEELPFQPQSRGSCPRTRKLSIYQKETFLVSQNGPEVSFLKTFESPLYRFSQNDGKRRPLFLRCEPWVDADRIERDKVVYLECRCDISLGNVEYNPGIRVTGCATGIGVLVSRMRF